MEKNLINIQSSQVWNTFNTAVFASAFSGL